jgi:hypothetical protein
MVNSCALRLDIPDTQLSDRITEATTQYAALITRKRYHQKRSHRLAGSSRTQRNYLQITR